MSWFDYLLIAWFFVTGLSFPYVAWDAVIHNQGESAAPNIMRAGTNT